MNSLRVVSVAVLACALCSSCARRVPDRITMIRVLFDPSSAVGKRFDGAVYRFSLAMQKKSPHDRILVVFYVVRSYREVLEKLSEGSHPQLVVLNRQTDKSEIGEVAQRLGNSTSACGLPTYIPDWTSPTERKAAQTFLEWLVDECQADAAARQ